MICLGQENSCSPPKMAFIIGFVLIYWGAGLKHMIKREQTSRAYQFFKLLVGSDARSGAAAGRRLRRHVPVDESARGDRRFGVLSARAHRITNAKST